MPLSALSLLLAGYILVLFFFAGASAGSFIWCIFERGTAGGSALRGRSKCPACGHTLSMGELIPVVSYIVLRGKCSHCGGRIPPGSFFAETALGLCYAALAAVFGLSLLTLEGIVLFTLMFAASVSDIMTLEIPVQLLVAVSAEVLISEALRPDRSGLLSGAFTALIFLIVLLTVSKLVSIRTATPSLGEGDLWLMTLMAFRLRASGAVIMALITAVTGLIYGVVTHKSGGKFELIPAISFASLVTFLFGGKLAESWFSFVSRVIGG